MAMNLGDPAALYFDLARHVGHELTCVRYGTGENIAIECETCHEVLVDADVPTEGCVQPEMLLAPYDFNIWDDELDVDLWASTLRDALAVYWAERSMSGVRLAITMYGSYPNRPDQTDPTRWAEIDPEHLPATLQAGQ